MKRYYCLNLEFKNKEISKEIHHAHLYIEKDDTIYLKIFFEQSNSLNLDRKFMISKNSLGLFNDNFNIIETESNLLFDNSRIYQITSFKEQDGKLFLTIYINEVCLINELHETELKNIGVGYLNNNGFDIVSDFYSFFSNRPDNQDVYENSRMQGMEDFYKIDKMSFRPELEYNDNDKRNKKEFTIKKIPTIYFKHDNLNLNEIQKRLTIICSFISFCYGIRVYSKRFVFSTTKERYTLRNNEPKYKTYVSRTLTVFDYLNTFYNLDKVLKTDWYTHFSKDEERITKAINSYLHSREVNQGSAFLLLYHILELFKEKATNEKFEIKNKKDRNEIFDKAFDEVKKILVNKSDEEEFKKKWDSLTGSILFRPSKEVFQETFKANTIKVDKFKDFSFDKIRKTRNDLTHGSYSKNEKELEEQVYYLRRIAGLLILSNLGFKEKLNDNYIYNTIY